MIDITVRTKWDLPTEHDAGEPCEICGPSFEAVSISHECGLYRGAAQWSCYAGASEEDEDVEIIIDWLEKDLPAGLLSEETINEAKVLLRAHAEEN
jgi:hypothetical protein